MYFCLFLMLVQICFPTKVEVFGEEVEQSWQEEHTR